jgi:hypothetical protein
MPLASHEPETIVALGCRALAGQEVPFAHSVGRTFACRLAPSKRPFDSPRGSVFIGILFEMLPAVMPPLRQPRCPRRPSHDPPALSGCVRDARCTDILESNSPSTAITNVRITLSIRIATGKAVRLLT